MRTRPAIAALALLALGALPAAAQPRAPVDVVQAPASAASASPPSAQEPVIHRWVDSHGQVHYSDKPPRTVPAEKVETVEVKPNSIDTSQAYEANLRIIQQADDARAAEPQRQAERAPAAAPPAPAPAEPIAYPLPPDPRLRPGDYWPAGPIPPARFTPTPDHHRSRPPPERPCADPSAKGCPQPTPPAQPQPPAAQPNNSVSSFKPLGR